MKNLLLENAHSLKQNGARGTRRGTSLLVLRFKGNRFLGLKRFDDVETAREEVYPEGRYNYLHTRFTVAKKNGKKILHLENTKLGEVFILKEKDTKHFSSLLEPYLNK